MGKRKASEGPGAMYCPNCWESTVAYISNRAERIPCPECGSKKVCCIYAYRSKDGRRRKYECRSCGAQFTTTERFSEGSGRTDVRKRMYKCRHCGKNYISEEFVENADRRRTKSMDRELEIGTEEAADLIIEVETILRMAAEETKDFNEEFAEKTSFFMGTT